MAKKRIRFRPRGAGIDAVRVVSGQVAKALVALVDAGPRGVTALECGGWAFRLAAYTHHLRHKYGLVIRTDRERHEHGWHGRHVLETAIDIEQIDGEPPARAA